MKKLIVILLLALFACEKDDPATLTGSWDANFDALEFKMHIVQRGSALTGDYTFEYQIVPIAEGRVYGDSVYIVNDYGEHKTIVRAKYTENTMQGKVWYKSDDDYFMMARFRAVR